MSNPSTRYEKLGFKDALKRTHLYPTVCKELSFILREAYHKLPKNLQVIVFHDTLAAFRLLPQMETRSAVSAAQLLHRSAEAALPKQKKTLAVKEFKHAKVAHKRRFKAHQEGESTSELPEDVLLHIFGLLDMQSLVSVGLVCWSWNLAASYNHLWQSHYAIFFGENHNSLKVEKKQNDQMGGNKDSTVVQVNTVTTSIDWREAFKRAYTGNSSKRFASNRGYCARCKAIVWLDNLKCSNGDCGLKSKSLRIEPISTQQVVEYVLHDSALTSSFSESDDSDTDEGFIPKLWAYPRWISE